MKITWRRGGGSLSLQERLSKKGRGQGGHQERGGVDGGRTSVCARACVCVCVCVCLHTGAFHKERSRKLPRKAQCASINLEGTLESSIKKGWSIL